MSLCTKVLLSMSSMKGTIHIKPKVIQLAVFTHGDLCVVLTLFS